MRTILGIAGHIGAGKDTIAARLVMRHGFVRIGFADALKHEVARILRRTVLAYAAERGFLDSDADPEAAITRLLWHDRTPVTRALLQEWGTELRRREDPDYWLLRWRDAAFPYPRAVVPDVRFANEARFLRACGGRLVNVVRPGYGGDTHVSEAFVDTWSGWDATIDNSGTLDDLMHDVDELVGALWPAS